MKKTNKLIIRFKPKRKIGLKVYDVVVIRKINRKRGAAIEKLGYINMAQPNSWYVLDISRASYWMNKGAEMHPTVVKAFSSLWFNF